MTNWHWLHSPKIPAEVFRGGGRTPCHVVALIVSTVLAIGAIAFVAGGILGGAF